MPAGRQNDMVKATFNPCADGVIILKPLRSVEKHSPHNKARDLSRVGLSGTT